MASALGAHDLALQKRGVEFKADPETLCRVCYRGRIISRVLAPLARQGAAVATARRRDKVRVRPVGFWKLGTR